MAPITTFEHLEDDFTPPTFVDTDMIIRMHDHPRFGKGDDIMVLMDKNASGDEKRAYVVGCFLWSILIFLILAVWAIILVTFKKMGKRVGFLSGMTPVIPPPPPSITDEEEEDMTNPALKLHTGHRLAAAVALCQKHFDEKTKSTQSLVKALRRDKNVHTAMPVESSMEAVSSSGSSTTERAQRELDGSAQSSCRVLEVHDVPLPESSGHGPNEEDDDPSAEEWRNEVMRVYRLVRRTRIVVLVCGFCIIVAAVLQFTKGVSSLVESLKDTKGSVESVKDVAEQGLLAINAFLYEESAVRNATRHFINDTLAGFCQNASNDTAVEEILNAGKEVVDAFEDFEQGLIIDEVERIQSDLEETLEIIKKIEKQLTGFTWGVNTSAALMALLIIVVMGLMAGVALAWAERLKTPFRRAHSYIILPLFYICLCLAWLFTTIFVLGSIVTADFCVDSPTPPVQLILENNEYRFISLVYEMIFFYISGCSEALYIDTFDAQWIEAVHVINATHNFIWSLSEVDPTELSDYCNVQVESVTVVVAAARYIDAKFHVYLEALDDVRRFFFCSNWNPIYTGVFYDALCYNGVNGLGWIYLCELIIVCCSMIIITLRVAWHEVERESDSGDASDIDNECTKQENESTAPRGEIDVPAEEMSSSQ